MCRSFEGPLAQLVEQLAFNQLVARSNRARPTIFNFNVYSDNAHYRFPCD